MKKRVSGNGSPFFHAIRLLPQRRRKHGIRSDGPMADIRSFRKGAEHREKCPHGRPYASAFLRVRACKQPPGPQKRIASVCGRFGAFASRRRNKNEYRPEQPVVRRGIASVRRATGCTSHGRRSAADGSGPPVVLNRRYFGSVSRSEGSGHPKERGCPI